MSRTILACFSDIHSGHRLGLMNPEVDLFDEDENGNLIPYHPKPTATQTYLWKCFCDDLAGVIELAAGDDVTLIYLGDPTQGKAFGHDLVTTRMADQVIIAVANFGHAIRYLRPKRIYLATGTEVHEFYEGSATILVAEQLRKAYPDVTVEVVNQCLAAVGEAEIDFAHHGPPPGIRMWTRGNAARYYLLDIMHKEIEDRGRAPDLVLRGHYHEFVFERAVINTIHGDHEAAICLVPSYCFVDSYIRRATRSLHTHDVGLAVFEVVAGQIARLHKFSRRIDLRTRKVIG
jgi:hypothetical protein